MYDAGAKEQFVELRAQGKSFVVISEQLGVSKTTLIEWSEDLKVQVSNLRSIHDEALREKYRIAKEHQLKTLSRQLESVENELEKRGLADVPTDKLFGMLFKIMTDLRGEDRQLILQRTHTGSDMSGLLGYTATWEA